MPFDTQSISLTSSTDTNAPVCIEERVTTSPYLRMGQTRSTEDARVDVLSAVLARAETDVAFRARLLTEPHRAIEDAFGIQVPHDFRLRFIERHSDVDALVVLPDVRLESSGGRR